MATVTDQRGNRPAHTGQEELRLEAPGRRRRPRTSWIALGLMVLVAFGLFGAVTIARVGDRDPVLALAKPIQRGEQLTSDHLRVVRVGTDDQVAVVEAAQRDEMVGLTATASLGAGTLVSHEQFAAGPSLGPGESVVGLALAPGEYPTVSLRPADLVVAVGTPDPDGGDRGAEGQAMTLAESAEVFAVEALSESARTLMVSIAVPQELAPPIAAAAAQGRVRLILVGRS